MEENIKQEKIELYLTGQLKDNDLKEFEETLETDKDFAQDVEIMRDLEEAMSDFEYEKELSNKLKFLGKKYITEDIVQEIPTTRIVPIFRRKWLVAATILLIVVAGGGLLFQNVFHSEPGVDLFANYYKPYPSDLLIRGENDEAYTEIVKLYNEEDFSTTISLLEQRLIELPNDTPSKILLGNSYLSLKPAKVDKAIETFKPLAHDGENVYNETAQWYLGLSYIKNDQDELAKTVLKLLSSKKYGKYPKLAHELLQRLEL